MAGKHSGTPRNSVAAGLETIGIIALIVTVPAAFLSLAGFGIYAAVTYPAAGPVIMIAFPGVMFISAVARVAGRLRHRQPRSLAGRADLIERLVIAGIFAVTLANVIGDQLLKLDNGALNDAAVAAAAVAVVAIPVYYWLGGRRRLLAALAARTAPKAMPH